MSEAFTVDTLEGTMTGQAGDFLIIGIQGEQYPCKKAIFEATYELVQDEPEAIYGACQDCGQVLTRQAYELHNTSHILYLLG